MKSFKRWLAYASAGSLVAALLVTGCAAAPRERAAVRRAPQGEVTATPAPGVAGDTRGPKGAPKGGAAGGYNIEQATSDRAQLNTIAFDGLGFLTGSLGSDSFFPPGKVADFWGFQYLRDNDSTQMGHNTDFLTKAALNMYSILDTSQRAKLRALASKQVGPINQYGYNRFVLMTAFRRLVAGDLPKGTSGLDPAAVKAYSAKLYRLDGAISYERAKVMGAILSSLSDEQKARLAEFKGQGMASLPMPAEPDDMRSLTRDEKVAVMTYSGDLFSWYMGDVEADTYFCPERHGTYFGSFYLKDAKAVGNPGYSIPTTWTGDMGEAFLGTLSDAQRAEVTGLVESQRSDLSGIVDVRRDVSARLRTFIGGSTPDSSAIQRLMAEYGSYDGDLSYRYATAFARVAKTLTPAQKRQMLEMRTVMTGGVQPDGAYLYSQEIPAPKVRNTDFLFK